MSAVDLSHAPGCYASAIVYRAEAPECASCPFVFHCGPRAEAAYAAICLRYGIKPAKPRKLKGVVKPSRADRAAEIIRHALQAGINPFTRVPELKLICHVLLNSSFPVRRQVLTMLFEQLLKKAPAEAETLVEEKLRLLLAAKAVVIDGDIILLIKRP